MADFGPSITACRLWEKVSARGNKYMVGRLGGLRVTILAARENEEGGATHVMIMGQADITTRLGQGSSPHAGRAPEASTAEQASLPIRRYPASARARSPGRPKPSTSPRARIADDPIPF